MSGARSLVLRRRGFLCGEITRCDVPGDPRTTVTFPVGVAMAADQEIQLLRAPTAADRARHAMRAALGLQD